MKTHTLGAGQSVDFIHEWNEVCMLKFHVGLMTDDALRQQIVIQWNMAKYKEVRQGSKGGLPITHHADLFKAIKHHINEVKILQKDNMAISTHSMNQL